MKYMLLIYDDMAAYETVSEEEQGALFSRYIAFTERLARAVAWWRRDPCSRPLPPPRCA